MAPTPFRLALTCLLAVGALAAAALVGATRAHANGILVTDAVAPAPMPPDRIRPMPPPPMPPQPMPPPQRWSPVRLKNHRVSAQVIDQTAEVVVEQVFHSDADRQLEGTYLFPLPEGAAVGRFAMTMGGRMVEGAVIEAQEARRVYQSIVSRRRDPGLLEYMGRGLFQARVFPIEPHQDLTIRLVFQLVLREDAGTVEFRYPLASDRLNGQPVDEVLVDVKIESGVDLKTVWSPSHQVAISREGEKKARVSFERSGRRQDKDFLMYFGRSPEAVGFSLVSSHAPGEDGTFMAVFAPRQQSQDVTPKDVVYVLDTSGSMVGEKLEQAKKALKLGVGLLRPGDRFNVIGFSTGLNPFREGLVDVGSETRAAASAWIDGLQAVGGTNIEGALEAALRTQSGGRLLLVMFVTDGRPTVGERAAGELLKKAQAWNASKARVFTFGVGSDLDVALLDTLAEATNGARDYVAPGEDLELVTGRFLTKIDRPVLTDVSVELGSGVSEVYPQKIPDLFAGGQVVLFGRYQQAGERTLVLRGKVGAKEVVYEHRGALASEAKAPWLTRLWAYRKVAFLLDDMRLRGEAKEAVDEVIRLATRYAIVTPYTSGLVVEDGELEGRPRLAQGGEDRDLRRRLDLPSAGGGAARRGFGGPGGSAPRDGALPRPPGVPAAPTPMAVAPGGPVPEAAPAESKHLKAEKERATADGDDKDAGDSLARIRERVQSVGTRSFVLRGDGRWTDTAYDGKAETVKVEAYSEAWLALAAKGDEVAKILALGERLVFMLDGKAYEVTPPAAK